MAGTAVSATNEFSAVPQSEIEHLRVSLNLLVDDVEKIRAALVAVATRLDSDAGVTGTVYTATDCGPINPATDLTAYKVNLR